MLRDRKEYTVENPNHTMSLDHWKMSRELTNRIYYIAQMQAVPSKTTRNLSKCPSCLSLTHEQWYNGWALWKCHNFHGGFIHSSH